MKKLSCFVLLAVAMAFIGQVISTGDIEAAKKKVLFPYKIVAVTDKTGGSQDSVWFPTENDISDLSTKGGQGRYNWNYMPGHGDSATNGIDSLTTGLFYDTLDFFFDVTDYDGGWIGYGVSDWDTLHGDIDSNNIRVSIALGTELGNAGEFYPIRFLAIQERGIGTGTIDTFTYSSLCEDSMFVLPLNYDVAGGVEADSTLFLDKLRLRYEMCDSALILDQENDHSIEFRAWMLVKEEY